ncbi:hypothetical protein C6503_16930 [Candidatus Poribacteria bacterium]|nr:MAG: hypothetical protein C6503_16930 [Candidatus Poribacteria bacterium]
MFFTPTLDSNWFVVQQASRYLMVLLLVFALFIPLLHMPQESEAVVLTAVAVGTLIVSGAAVAVTLWIYNDGKCDYCGNGRETDHTGVCTNCHSGAYHCPGLIHGHTAYCYYCDDLLYTCDAPGGSTAAEVWAPHGEQTCDYCSNKYIPCKEGDDHGDGVCNDDNDQGASSSSNSSTGTG